MPGLLVRLVRSRRGAAALEFAFVVPLFVVLMLGGIEIVATIRAYTKAQTATENFAQLIVSRPTLNYDDFTDYCRLANSFFESYNADYSFGHIVVFIYWVQNGSVIYGSLFSTCGSYTIYYGGYNIDEIDLNPNLYGANLAGSKDGYLIQVKSTFTRQSPLSAFLSRMVKINTTAVARLRFDTLNKDPRIDEILYYDR